jgi:Co/Zn/Cd efflux system component
VNKTIFEIPAMDCPSEERMVRMALEPVPGIKELSFDLEGRKLLAVHEGRAHDLLERLLPLGFGSKIAETAELEPGFTPGTTSSDRDEETVLKKLLAINAVMFVAELGAGLLAQSVGLIADSLDMLADAFVYTLSLGAVGKHPELKKRAAKWSGYLQILLAVGALFEVVRRFLMGSDPEPPYMISVSLVALAANAACLALLSKHRHGGVHMKASWIFSSNDVIANLGVILGGVLVMVFKSNVPDLAIGAVIAVVVFRGALQILRLSAPPSVAAKG